MAQESDPSSPPARFHGRCTLSVPDCVAKERTDRTGEPRAQMVYEGLMQ